MKRYRTRNLGPTPPWISRYYRCISFLARHPRNYNASCRNQSTLKWTVVEIRDHISFTFLPSCKIRGGWTNCSSQVSSLPQNPTSYILLARAVARALRFNIFLLPVLGRNFVALHFQNWRSDLYQIWRVDMTITGAFNVGFEFYYIASFQNYWSSKAKFRPNFEIFDPL